MFSIRKRILSRLETLDLWFLVLRLVTILVGVAWYLWVPHDPNTQSIFGRLLSGFVGYTLVLYTCIFWSPKKIKRFYLFALAVDLLFIFLVLWYVSQLQESFFIALYLLVGLHSFYFGPLIGLIAATVASCLYAYLYVYFDYPLPFPDFLLRTSFLFLVATTFGLIALKVREDRERIEKLNLDLSHRNTVLQQSYRFLSIGKLIPTIAEKINNPLAVIMGRLHLLQTKVQKSNLPEFLTGELEAIRSSSHRIALLLRNLVGLSARGPVTPERVDLNELVQDTIGLMEGSLEREGVGITRKLSPDPMFILGNNQELREAIVHIINNATDAVSPGGTIDIETFPEDSSLGRILLRVSDRGVGIRGEDLEKVFTPFFTTKSAEDGIGLGLTAVLTIMKRHNGFISVQSEWGKGTVFTMSFPSSDGTGGGAL
ncbi:MAG: sensor histidine kinase [Candidatus Binatia bacterium]